MNETVPVAAAARRGARPRTLGAAVVLAVCAFTLVLRLQPGGALVTRAVDDLGQFAAALIGGVCIVGRSRAVSGRARASQLLLGGGLLCWAAGEAIWSFYEIVLRRPTPFPSWSDLGFLLFPVLALVALLLRPSAVFAGHGRTRVALDGVMVGCSVLAASWTTTLGAVYRGGAESTLAYVVGLAYPVGDIILLTVAGIVLVHGAKELQLLLVLAGIGLMAIADSGFAYLTAIDAYQTGSIVDIAWFAAFLLMGAASFVPESRRTTPDAETGVESSVLLAVPYVAVLASSVFAVTEILRGTIDPVLLMVHGAGMLALAARQFLTVLDNRRLARDVLAREAELHFRAFHDNLTGLANRALLHDRVTHALQLTRRDGRKVQLMFCDLDDFKTVNDSLGHDAGDELLVEVARRLRSCTRDGDTVARLGGDEFAILLEGDVDVDLVAQRVLAALEKPVEVCGRLLTVAASLGTASVEPDDDIGNHELLQRADRAMYAAKAAGKGGSVSFTPTLGRHASADLDERVTLNRDIRTHALPTQLVPLVDRDGTAFAVEAIAHWAYGGREVGHDRVLKLARRMGLGAEVALHSTQSALGGSTRNRSLPVAISLGGYAPDTERMLDRLGLLLEEHGLPADHVIVQLPECRPGEESQPLLLLARLREAGMRVALDDFGIGYSNLALLGDLKPDFVKLDRSLIAPLCGSRTAQLLARGVVALAHDLGTVVIAEGVETAEQHDVLLTIGCDAFQGRLFGEPELVASSDGLRAA